MAANRFASMLHRNSHKMTVILVYTILEWILIFLLLLNALFSYLITKFASYFGLRPPCLLCSRVDDLFEPPRGLKLFPDLLCEAHVAEISSLGYCPSHRRFRKGSFGICKSCSDDHYRKAKVEDPGDPSCACCNLPLQLAGEKEDDLVIKEPSLREFEVTQFDGLIGEQKEEMVMEERSEKEAVLSELEAVYEHSEVDSVAVSQSSEMSRRVHGADACIGILHPQDSQRTEPIEDGEVKRIQEEDEKTDGEISIGSEICDREHVRPSRLESIQSASEEEAKAENEGSREASLEPVGFPGEESEHDDDKASDHSGPNSRSISRAQSADIPDDILGEDRVDTPRSEDGTHTPKSYSDSVDGSLASELDSSEELTIDQLKTALQAERKSLSGLYAELEAERNASAIAANQTMAMITRLQEEKFSMQMEAKQYQRMIEEQSEYEQEEWQTLNDLLLARENEKLEMERELDILRAKVLQYEAKERKMKRSDTDGTLGAIDVDVESREEEFDGKMVGQYSPVGDVLSPREHAHSDMQLTKAERFLDAFENDRLAILEKLKSLEKRISSARRSEKPENLTPSNEKQDRGELDPEGTDESCEIGEPKKTSNGKSLLPLFNAAAENSEGEMGGQDAGSSQDSDFNLNETSLTIEKEVQNLRDAVEDLEFDRDIIMETIRLSKTGNRCITLLDEILEQLRNVRTAEATMGNETTILIAASA